MNAKERFLALVKEVGLSASYAVVNMYDDSQPEPKISSKLQAGHDKESYEVFLNSLDYDRGGFSNGELFGHIAFEDGSWIDYGRDNGEDYKHLSGSPK
ncbi:hypothetical protein N9137_02175 [Pseudomonadales bacterium]|nr:hypothetical protein [Pseudomonadales bacterium]